MFVSLPRIILISCLCWLLAGCETTPGNAPIASSGSDLGDKPLFPSQLTQQPIAMKRVPPKYPAEFRKNGTSGRVMVEFIVTKTGKVTGAHAVEFSHPQFAEAAVAAISQWLFRPGQVGNNAVACVMQQPISFDPAPSVANPVTSLPAPVPADLEVFDVANVTEMPRVRGRTAPVYPANLRSRGVTGEALVEFVVTTEGDVIGAHAVRSTHPQFAYAAVMAISQWKFLPGKLDGRVVNCRMQQPISFSVSED